MSKHPARLAHSRVGEIGCLIDAAVVVLGSVGERDDELDARAALEQELDGYRNHSRHFVLVLSQGDAHDLRHLELVDSAVDHTLGSQEPVAEDDRADKFSALPKLRSSPVSRRGFSWSSASGGRRYSAA